MTEYQLEALQAYIVAVTRFMMHDGDRAANVRSILYTRSHMELVFDKQLPTPLPNIL